MLLHDIAIWICSGIAALIVIICILIWVVVPLLVRFSIAVQRFLMFIPVDQPKNPDFHSPESYDITEAINFYIPTTDLDTNTVTDIGCWLIVPEGERSITRTTTDIGEIIRNTKYDVIFYLHGVAQNRAKSVHQYEILRKYFLVIAVDHRGYGDSGINVIQSEQGIINDNLQMFDWLRQKTQNDVYYWGHSLGSAITTHTVRTLKESRSFIPKGVVLESPFTTMKEEILSVRLGRLFSWLPYFEAAMLRPLEANGFHFYSATHILYVDCPIMVLHAEDDNVIPFHLGKKLAEIAQTQRHRSKQGEVIYHQFPAVGYQHVGITEDPKIPDHIEEFIRKCEDFKNHLEQLV